MTDLVQSAKLGDPKAIATLFNRQLNPKGIAIEATVRENTLDLLLESAQLLKKEAVVAGMRKRLVQLNPVSIQKVRLRALQTGRITPSWSHEFEINSPAPTAPIASIPANPFETADGLAAVLDRPSKIPLRVPMGEWVLLGFSLLIFAILCRFFRFTFFAGILLALIPATIAHNRGKKFLFWYAYGLNLYFPAVLHASFINGFNPYGIIFFCLGTILAQSLSSTIVLLLLVPNLAFAVIPALLVYSQKRDFFNWYIYGIVFFLVAVFHAFLIETKIVGSFKNLDLEKVSFLNRDLSGNNFQGSNLKGADFSKAKLVGTNFKNANLQNANFADANLWGTQFDGANLTGANLSRTSNRRGGKKSRDRAVLPWYLLVGLGLGICQLFLWIISFGSPLGLILSGEPQISWLVVLTRPPVVLSLFLLSAVLVLTLIAIVLKRQYKLALLLGLVGLSSSLTVAFALFLQGLTTATSAIAIASISSIVLTFGAIGSALQAWKMQRWLTYSTAVGIVSAMGFWAIALAPGTATSDRYLALLVPPQLSSLPQLAGLGAIAVLAAWGALAGRAIGILAAKRTTSFRETNLTGANFTQAELFNADFTDARTRGVNWGGAKLISAIAFPRKQEFDRPTNYRRKNVS
ncbi:MAG: pentapeptide repeat-containing protein [Cyanobacteriota bacterium]|nr:pentapeptide repeat-containing protein [Cyanobacteriota bacterium]